MAIIEVVKYDGPPGIFAWKYPNQELGTWTQLIVNESQEAILFKGGQALDSFTARAAHPEHRQYSYFI